MPLQREAVVHGFKCKFYDDGVVKVGTTAAARFTMRPIPDGDFDEQLLMELDKQKAKGRQLELPAAALTSEFNELLATTRAQAASKKAASSAASAEQAAASAARAKLAGKLAAVRAHQQVPEGEKPSLELIGQLNQETKNLSIEQLEAALAEAKVSAHSSYTAARVSTHLCRHNSAVAPSLCHDC